MTIAPIRFSRLFPAPLAWQPDVDADHRWAWSEILILLIGPIAGFLLMHFKPFGQNHYLDPYIYTGYINNFAELFTRYGLTYYVVRFGLLLPGQLFALLFGPVGGYFVFRYCLVLLSGGCLYALSRQRYGRAVATAIFAVFVTSPWLARAALWDYSDASGVPFLLASLSLIQLEHFRRYTVDFLAGCVAALAIHSNFFVVAPFGAFVAAYCVLWLVAGRGLNVLAGRAIAAAAGMLVVTGIGVTYYWLRIGQWDVFTVTLHVALGLATGGTEQWKVAGLAWVGEVWTVLTPILLAVVALAAYGFKRLAFHDQVAFFGSLATTIFFYVNEFLMGGNSLQLFYYFSYNLPATMFLLASILGCLAQRGIPCRSALLFVLAAVIPWSLFTTGLTTLTTWTLIDHAVLVAATVVVVTLSGVVRRGRTLPTMAALILGVMFWSCFARPAYKVMFNSWRQPDYREQEVYRVSLELIDAVHTLTAGTGGLRFWYSNLPLNNPMNSVQSTYLWGYSKVQGDGPGLPLLAPKELPLITAPNVRWLVLLAEQPEQLPQARETLQKLQIAFRPVALRVLSSGNYHLHFQLLELKKG